MMKTILLFLLLLIQPYTAAAATYYISAAGSDSADGLTTGTAWQTVANLNAGTGCAADAIYAFRRGDTFGQVILPCSGTSGHPVTITAYGAGVAPMFTTGSLIGDTGAISSFNRSYIRIENVMVTSSPYGIWLAGSGVGHAIDTVEASGNALDGVIISGQTDTSVTTLTSHGNARHGLSFVSSADRGIVTGGTFSNNGPTFESQGCGISVYGANTVTITGTTAVGNWYGLKTFGADVYTANVAIVGNDAHGNLEFGIDIDYSDDGITVDKNLVYSNGSHGIAIEFTAGVQVRWNYTRNNAPVEGGAGIEITGSTDAIVLGNQMWNERNGLGLYTNPDNAIVINNTISTTVDACIHAGYLNDDLQGLVLKNNLTSACGTFALTFDVYAPTITSDYNLWATGASGVVRFNSTTYTLASWVSAAALDTHSLSGSAGFMGEASGNLRLTATSQARGAGAVLISTYESLALPTSTWPGAVMVVAQAPAWDMGAVLFRSVVRIPLRWRGQD